MKKNRRNTPHLKLVTEAESKVSGYPEKSMFKKATSTKVGAIVATVAAVGLGIGAVIVIASVLRPKYATVEPGTAPGTTLSRAGGLGAF